MERMHQPRNYGKKLLKEWKQYPDVLRWRGSVWPTILPSVFGMGILSFAIAYAYIEFHVKKLALPPSVISSISIVLGLLLAFRTNTAYSRYSEGRQLWQSIVTTIRNQARVIWCNIPEKTQADHLEKMRCMKLLLAFAVASKHHIRGEYGTDYYDLDRLLPPNWTPSAGQIPQEPVAELHAISKLLNPHLIGDPLAGASVLPGQAAPGPSDSEQPLAGGGDNPDNPVNQTMAENEASQNFPSEALRNTWTNDDDLPDEADADMSLPLEIIFRVGLYVAQCNSDDKIDSVSSGTITTGLNTLIDCLGSFERIVNTPIPKAYTIHLKQALGLYLVALPFTLVASSEWMMIPIVALASFTLFGIEGIGSEIENPFGYQDNDLPLNQYCEQLRKEIEYIIYYVPPETENILVSGR